MREKRLILSLVVLLVLSLTTISFSQGVTTASLRGKVVGDNNEELVGANVVATHLPSGTVYGAVTRKDGRFNILGMRVGGPYRVVATFIGYQNETYENVYLTLGNTTELNFQLNQQDIQVKEVTVEGKKDPVFNPQRTGASVSIQSENINYLPTLTRRIGDLTRLTPQAKGNSFVGQDNRLNNITVDGSYFNNSFGLAGQPGERTGVAPISLDAIEQIQVNIAPFDVRQGNFVGANVNTVTKSGTNEYSGSVYYSYRNEKFYGTSAKDLTFDPGKFDYNLYGFRVGGPILRDKLFFFASVESDNIVQPATTYIARPDTSTPIGGNVTRVLASDLNKLSAYLKDKFGYETGGYQGYNFETPAKRYLLRFDYNLDANNKISLRYSHLDSKTDVLLSNSSSLGFGTRRSTVNALNFENSNYIILENIRSIVAEWNSVLASNIANNLIVGYRYHDESREPVGQMFPFVDILSGSAVYTSFGFEPFTPNNELRYKSFQVQNNLSLFIPKHNLLFGASYERFSSENIFFPGSQSVYVYNSLSDFYKDADGYLANPSRDTSNVLLRRFQVRWSNIPGQDKPIQPMTVHYVGAYAQDEIELMDNLRVTAGLRVDIPFFEKTGYRNPEVETFTFRDENGNPVKYATDKLPDPKPLWSPRLGFNFDVFGDKKTQLRGGTGIFTGQPAFVWISNQIGNNGILTGFERLDNTYKRPFNPDINRYKPKTVTGAPASNYELALTDPNFKFPQIWRNNIAVDQKIPFFDLIGTVEFLYSKDINGIYYINANLKAPDTVYAGVDNRPRWKSGNKIISKIDNAIVLKNQDVGYSTNFTVALERPFQNGFYGKMAYSYGISKNTVDAGSIAFGSWNNNPHSGNPNNPGVSYSAYNPDHRAFLALSYRAEYFDFGATTLSLFAETFTGGRTSYVFSGDANGDGGTSNDLIYIPRDKNEMNFQQYSVTIGTTTKTFTVDQQKEAWEQYINNDEYLKSRRGQYAERNGVKLPAVFRMDLSLQQEFYTNFLNKRNTLAIRLDIINFTNLLNKNWGVGQQLVTNAMLTNPTVDSQGRLAYRLYNKGGELITSPLTQTLNLDDVYKIQLSIRYMFN